MKMRTVSNKVKASSRVMDFVMFDTVLLNINGEVHD